MPYDLQIFGNTYENVKSISAKDTSNNLRTYIEPTGLITDANGTARKIYLTTIEAVPSGAVTGDIVFVKVT